MTFESAILAGGKNSRYGGLNKAFIQLEGIAIIDRNIEVLQKLFSRISIITNHPEQFSNYKNYPMASDYFHEVGPLAGIHSALKNAKSDAVFISSCDMPFLDEGLINRLMQEAVVSGADAVIPRVETNIEPLFALYFPRVLYDLEAHIHGSEDLSIRSFLKNINTRYIDFEATRDTRKAFVNINRPEDLDLLDV